MDLFGGFGVFGCFWCLVVFGAFDSFQVPCYVFALCVFGVRMVGGFCLLCFADLYSVGAILVVLICGFWV